MMITVIQTTSDTKEELQILSKKLVEGHLAACCQIEGPITSTYIWKGDYTTSEEFKLNIKTTVNKASEVEKFILEHHSYETPEVLHFEVQASEAYEAWVRLETSAK